MTEFDLHTLLVNIVGRLAIDSTQTEADLNMVFGRLALSHMPEEPDDVISGSFSFSDVDRSSETGIPAQRLEAIRSVEDQIKSATVSPQFRVFVREVPVRSSLFAYSIPDWAPGAKASFTVGPFNNNDKRKFWFDFYATEQFISLAVQGEDKPALLFRMQPATAHGRNIALGGTTSLSAITLAPGGIWILSRLLAHDAPPDCYT